MTLSIRNVVKRFGTATALHGVSLDVPAGELVCFLGPSGCGKTTLLRIVAGLELCDEGAIELDGRDLSAVPARQRGFGMVFQSYSLFPNMSARRNIGYGLECRGRSRQEIDERTAAMLRLIHLEAHADKLPAQLSGGQQQRVALARALAIDPALLLLDEPLSALDAKVREDLQVEIRALQRRLGVTTIMVTHDQDEALAMADTVVVMRDGRIEQVGAPAELYGSPATSFVAGFVGRMNMLRPGGGPSGDRTLAGRPIRVEDGRHGPVLAIRPEDVVLCEADDPGENRLAGTVQDSLYLGSRLRLTIRPDNGADGEVILAELPGRTMSAPAGSRVGVYLPANALRVLG